MPKQIEIARRPERIRKPDRLQHRALQDEALPVVRLSKPVEQALVRVTYEE